MPTNKLPLAKKREPRVASQRHSWLDSCPGPWPSPSESNAVSRRVYRNGKLVPIKEPKARDTRAVFFRKFINQLNLALKERARHLERLNTQRRLSKQLRDETVKFFKRAIETVDRTGQQQRPGAPPTLSNARSLVPAVEQFDKSLEDLLEHGHPRASELAMCLRGLCDDVRHYVSQIDITSAIVDQRKVMPTIPNRPTNWDAKEFYGRLLERHQRMHGDQSFPKPRDLRRQLSEAGYDFSERTLRDWRSQWVRGSFGNHIQDRYARFQGLACSVARA